ncbi:heat-inducible transcription repressor HrcA [Novimethylophilus kurashikiensis]|uniref:Heat-inducible transcription repressor HrcA n=1 Tax=Novimethylophilus kurashikiensis TaxID=1825523 RepID=A0A2R5FAK0_9PROT|nr:hypothetical protein [Novimethylophilus kurashikiensis]GBG14578.1 heat-inducible transcription repressor HrcA [Novimethylophilus kurashikiensis]
MQESAIPMEFNQVKSMAREAIHAGVRVILVSSEPGVSMGRLIDELLTELTAEGRDVMYTTPLERTHRWKSVAGMTSPTPYSLLNQAAEQSLPKQDVIILDHAGVLDAPMSRGRPNSEEVCAALASCCTTLLIVAGEADLYGFVSNPDFENGMVVTPTLRRRGPESVH